jgi:hypothetical protein
VQADIVNWRRHIAVASRSFTAALIPTAAQHVVFTGQTLLLWISLEPKKDFSTNYSYRNASIGSKREAFQAG